MTWATKELGDLAELDRSSVPASEIEPGTNFIGLEHIEAGGRILSVQTVRNGELASSKFRFSKDHLLYGKLRPYLAKIALPTFSGICSTDIIPVLPGPNLDRRYLCYFLRQGSMVDYANSRAAGANLPRLSPKELAKIQIPLPPLAEQKRIAAILDAADALRAKRREALAQLDTLLQATFLDLFGDPLTNPKGWEVVPMSTAVASFEGGKNYNPIDEERSDGFRVLKVSAVTSGEYLPRESKPFAEEETVPAEYVVRESDLLISRANTSELVGAVVYVRRASGREILPDKLWRFIWAEPRVIEPLYMLHVARSKYFRRHLIQRATGTSGSMKNIGKEKMLGIPIPLPPIALQRQFARVVQLIEDQKERALAYLAELDTFFASLQSRAFRGEL